MKGKTVCYFYSVHKRNNNNQTNVVVSTAYKVDGDGFLPLLLIQDAGIVAQDVDSSEGVFGFLEGSLRAENNSVRFHISTSPSSSVT